ncbi:MAG: CheR family methyltransferase, partial [Steroidobacteraceae bacterium]
AATPNATLILLARVCANLGDLAHARYWAERAVAADRINAPLHYLRAVILEEQGLADEALLALKRALYLAPEFVLAHVALGNLARGAGRARDANRHFTNALGLLGRCKDEDLLPHAEGMAVGALRRTIQSVMDGEVST